MIARSWFIGTYVAVVFLTLAVHAAQTAAKAGGDASNAAGPGMAKQWKYLPPRDVDPKAATLENPIPRRWSPAPASAQR